MSRFFHQLYITKPLTSRPANSEVYIVGKGFKGIDATTIKNLLGKISSYNKAGDTSKPLLDLDDSMLPTILEIRDAAVRIHSEQQTKFIEEAVDLARREDLHSPHGLKKSLEGLARKLQEQWLKDNPVLKINTKDHLPSSR
jgi:hypothetical protein